MANCPNCGTYLQTVRNRDGIYSHCSQCDGRALTFPQIRRTTGDRYLSSLIRQVRIANEISPRPCPFCENPMRAFLLSNPPVSLEGCMSCTMVWFDAGKFEQLPEGAGETPEDAMFRAIEAEGKWKMEQQKNRDQSVTMRDPPDEWWKWIPAVLGMPVKFENAEVSKRPWATWSLAAVITIVSFIGFFDLEDAVDNFGFIPAERWRYGGITFLTSFFLHGGFWHLFGNMYFFLLFSGEVEESIGHWRLLTLTFLSALTGDVLQVLVTPGLDEPCIGASGGISGIMVFYALKFPGSKLAFFWWRLGWVHLPAWSAFFLWILLQIISYALQRNGASSDHVGYLAHFGGVLAGFLLWLWWRKLRSNKDQSGMPEL
jgi:membrane associated rhomboid family serine protease